MSYTDKYGNRITLQDNGVIGITPKGESTHFYTLREIVEILYGHKKEVMINKSGWVYCPKCHGKTKTKVNRDTKLHHFPLFCPKCKQESVVDVEKMEVRLSEG